MQKLAYFIGHPLCMAPNIFTIYFDRKKCKKKDVIAANSRTTWEVDFDSAIYNHFQFFWKILKLKQILNFLKNGPWPYFRDNSYEIYYISLIEFSWVWAWSPNFNFFSNKKRGVQYKINNLSYINMSSTNS